MIDDVSVCILRFCAGGGEKDGGGEKRGGGESWMWVISKIYRCLLVME